jgi:hypothetical protein
MRRSSTTCASSARAACALHKQLDAAKRELHARAKVLSHHVKQQRRGKQRSEAQGLPSYR